jgi:excisionase family DNA binding protein
VYRRVHMNTLSSCADRRRSKIMTTTYTLQEASQMLGLSEMTVRRRIKQGKIKAKIQYNRYLIEKDDLPIPTNVLRFGIQTSVLNPPPCDLTSGLQEHDLRMNEENASLTLYQACIITGYIGLLFYRVYALGNIALQELSNEVEKELGQIGLSREDFNNEDKILVKLIAHPNIARHLYKLASCGYAYLNYREHEKELG